MFAGEGADAVLVDDDLAIGERDVGVDGSARIVGREEVRRKGAEYRVAGMGVERTMSWLAGCRELHRLYERKARTSWPAPSSTAADSPIEISPR